MVGDTRIVGIVFNVIHIYDINDVCFVIWMPCCIVMERHVGLSKRVLTVHIYVLCSQLLILYLHSFITFGL